MFFQVKYVYDWAKPTFASVVIIVGAVNASDRKTTSGSSRRTSSISQSQKGIGFVCGLSTRKMRTPRCTQTSTTSSSACQRPRQSSEPKLTL